MRTPTFAAIALAASMAALPLVPACAASPQVGATATEPANVAHPSGATATSEQNPLLTDSGAVRAGKLIGTDVYNNKDQKLGTVDGVVIGTNGQPQVIVSHDGKLYPVAWNEMKFGDAKKNGDNKAMIPNMTKDQFGQMKEFHYNARQTG
ncbi:MAG: PRC-barrel domain-containing protein [Alphaproteobacteria bacterium]|nr:PRC-barrel domain-containing protein [Alphaproteobacteria bacterium]